MEREIWKESVHGASFCSLSTVCIGICGMAWCIFSVKILYAVCMHMIVDVMKISECTSGRFLACTVGAALQLAV